MKKSFVVLCLLSAPFSARAGVRSCVIQDLVYNKMTNAIEASQTATVSIANNGQAVLGLGSSNLTLKIKGVLTSAGVESIRLLTSDPNNKDVFMDRTADLVAHNWDLRIQADSKEWIEVSCPPPSKNH